MSFYQFNKDFFMKKFAPVLIVAVALFGCSKNNADQFVGSWKKVAGQGTDMVISKNGDGFLMKQQNFLGNDVTYTGVAKEDGLDISGPMGAVHFVIDKSSGHLVGAGEELARAN